MKTWDVLLHGRHLGKIIWDGQRLRPTTTDAVVALLDKFYDRDNGQLLTHSNGLSYMKHLVEDYGEPGGHLGFAVVPTK